MSDLISREVVLESLKTDNSLIMFDGYGNLTFTGERIIEAIKRVPSVEPERKRGKWIWNRRTGEYECSECGVNPTYEQPSPDCSEIDKYRFCRWCGAPMEMKTDHS